ncbi:MAG: hypothetical protein K8S56_05185 [Candidatus Cloacimonetes bacterium]|nr:hypothetical protein [Candidatus Cloacimonadota bacterium]
MSGQWKEILDSDKLGIADGVAQLDASGKLTSGQIPSIPPANISGVLSTSQIPSLDASKVTSGAFSSSRIPSLDATKITSGSLNADRIPTLAQAKVSGLSTSLAGKVSTSTKVNGKALSGDVNLKTSDIIEEVAELPESGIIGEIIAFEGTLYVWKGE